MHGVVVVVPVGDCHTIACRREWRVDGVAKLESRLDLNLFL